MLSMVIWARGVTESLTFRADQDIRTNYVMVTNGQQLVTKTAVDCFDTWAVSSAG